MSRSGADKISVIYEDENFLALNKPAGLIVHGAAGSLADWLAERYPEVKKVGDDPKNRPGIVHRLDKDTSGVILAARNQKYFDYLKGLFQKGGIKKNYLVLLYGRLEPRQGVINKPIGLVSGTVKRSVRGGKMVKRAVTEYRVKKHYRDFSLVEAAPKTGRTHQIRVHFAFLRHPVVGDRLYGPKRPPATPPLGRQFLHAESVEFSLADGRRIKISADLPDDLKKVLRTLERT